jgi:hypothetical protein
MLADNAHVKPFQPIAIAQSQKLQKKPLEVQLSSQADFSYCTIRPHPTHATCTAVSRLKWKLGEIEIGTKARERIQAKLTFCQQESPH